MTEAQASRPALAAPRAPFKRLSATDAWDFILERNEAGTEPLLLLDARAAEAFQRSHLEGAEHLSGERFQQLLTATPRDKAIVLYCQLGHTSQEYAAQFTAFGFSEVYSVDGGFEALAQEYAARRSAREGDADSNESAVRYLVGDVVFAREDIRNDGGIPELEEGALVAAAGVRGVVVQVGRVEADPRQTVYAVRFEMASGELGPMIGCLPEELTQPSS